MHRGHPLLCGTLLGLTWTLLSLLFQGADWPGGGGAVPGGGWGPPAAAML